MVPEHIFPSPLQMKVKCHIEILVIKAETFDIWFFNLILSA